MYQNTIRDTDQFPMLKYFSVDKVERQLAYQKQHEILPVTSNIRTHDVYSCHPYYIAFMHPWATCDHLLHNIVTQYIGGA